MTTGNPNRMAPWVLAGVLGFMLLVALVWRAGDGGAPARLLASKATRADLAGRLQVELARAAEAEKSAVLATTDEASQAFAAQAREAAAAARRDREELERLLAASGTPAEQALMAQLARAMGELEQVDEEVLGLAVKNTNLKAQAIAFGPMAEALAALDGALLALAGPRPDDPAAARARRLADGARLGVTRAQALLAPHIAEERDEGMDRLEAAMDAELARVREAVDALARLAPRAALADARARLDAWQALRRQVLALSRENTNVRSLALSLGRKRTAQAVCDEALAALRQAVLEEPIPGVSYGRIHPTR